MNYNPGAPPALNGKDQPVAKGGYISFYVTGDGATTPVSVDGRPPTSPNPAPAGAVSVRIGGVESACAYNWAGLVYAGVTQINACVPSNAPSGPAVPIEVSIGGAPSQSGVTIAVQ